MADTEEKPKFNSRIHMVNGHSFEVSLTRDEIVNAMLGANVLNFKTITIQVQHVVLIEEI